VNAASVRLAAPSKERIGTKDWTPPAWHLIGGRITDNGHIEDNLALLQQMGIATVKK
jgi:hypothetical protein